MRNERGFEVKAMCASCFFRGDYGKRNSKDGECYCELNGTEVGRHSACSQWAMRDCFKNVGNNLGFVRPKDYHIWYYMTQVSLNFSSTQEAYSYWYSKVKDTDTMHRLNVKFQDTPASLLITSLFGRRGGNQHTKGKAS